MKNLFAEQREQDLRRSPAHGPAHRDDGDPHHERNRAHVGQPLAVLVPAGRDERRRRSPAAPFAAPEARPGGARMCQMAQAEKTNESELMTNAHRYPRPAALSPASNVPGGQGGPLGGLGQRVGGVQLVGAGDGPAEWRRARW